ncbi:hypothetical protein BDK51DRAFT_38408 [Blyttiomyces helicus]|uniref:Uncharacterized protein n=1 Tax=Blyttiomyces helicus TaxID=388810 RepID=A0A4P9W4I7_9FUNG|nr:hypothetical protein BDK51DRAFT_38408 [Blyttiomyces helicus]|eukprot:RKO87114.1 hypothetical protein BDK51DRAFT_38408 [Blyttiomyces helicus]
MTLADRDPFNPLSLSQYKTITQLKAAAAEGRERAIESERRANGASAWMHQLKRERLDVDAVLLNLVTVFLMDGLGVAASRIAQLSETVRVAGLAGICHFPIYMNKACGCYAQTGRTLSYYPPLVSKPLAFTSGWDRRGKWMRPCHLACGVGGGAHLTLLDHSTDPPAPVTGQSFLLPLTQSKRTMPPKPAKPDPVKDVESSEDEAEKSSDENELTSNTVTKASSVCGASGGDREGSFKKAKASCLPASRRSLWEGLNEKHVQSRSHGTRHYFAERKLSDPTLATPSAPLLSSKTARGWPPSLPGLPYPCLLPPDKKHCKMFAAASRAMRSSARASAALPKVCLMTLDPAAEGSLLRLLLRGKMSLFGRE